MMKKYISGCITIDKDTVNQIVICLMFFFFLKHMICLKTEIKTKQLEKIVKKKHHN